MANLAPNKKPEKKANLMPFPQQQFAQQNPLGVNPNQWGQFQFAGAAGKGLGELAALRQAEQMQNQQVSMNPFQFNLGGAINQGFSGISDITRNNALIAPSKYGYLSNIAQAEGELKGQRIQSQAALNAEKIRSQASMFGSREAANALIMQAQEQAKAGNYQAAIQSMMQALSARIQATEQTKQAGITAGGGVEQARLGAGANIYGSRAALEAASRQASEQTRQAQIAALGGLQQTQVGSGEQTRQAQLQAQAQIEQARLGRESEQIRQVGAQDLLRLRKNSLMDILANLQSYGLAPSGAMGAPNFITNYGAGVTRG